MEESGVRIIREPSVYLVGRPSMWYEGPESADGFFTRYPTDWQPEGATDDAEELCEMAGRVCYMSFDRPRPGGNAAYLRHILEAGHGSVLEHAVWNFVFAGISRTCSHELVRHRAGWSYSQLSQRYVDSSDVAFVEPDAIAANEWAHGRWLTACQLAATAYDGLAHHLTAEAPNGLNKTDRRKWARQAARSALPGCAETVLFATANARALRHFIEQRASRHAEPEIRKLAVAVLRVMKNEAPALFGDYELVDLGDGTFEADTPYRKV